MLRPSLTIFASTKTCPDFAGRAKRPFRSRVMEKRAGSSSPAQLPARPPA